MKEQLRILFMFCVRNLTKNGKTEQGRGIRSPDVRLCLIVHDSACSE